MSQSVLRYDKTLAITPENLSKGILGETSEKKMRKYIKHYRDLHQTS